MAKDDYALSIEDVSKRLNKSVRTIHRYKDSGKLSFRVGTTQGNPLYFSKSEVESLARELYPNLAPQTPLSDPDFWDRLERVERLLSLFERNPLLERLLLLSNGAVSDESRLQIEQALKQLSDLHRSDPAIDRQELGRVLVRLGNNLLES